MSNLVLPRQFNPHFKTPRKKPVGPVEIDWSNPLSRGLMLFSVPITSGLGVYDAVKNRVYTDSTFNISQTSFETEFDHLGQYILMKGTGSAHHLELTEAQDNLNEGYRTVLTGAIYTNAAKDHTVLHHGTLVGSNEHILIWADTSGGVLRPGINSGASHFGTSGSIPVNEFVVWGTGYIVTSGAAAAQHWVNGEKSGSLGPDIGDTRFAAVQALNFGNQSGSGRMHEGSLYFYAMWDRELSEAEHLSFSKDPYQLLKPITPSVYFVSAGGPATITGSGSPQAETATTSGTGERIITGSGSPTAVAATTSGTGERVITGSGTPQAAIATSTGEGTVGTIITGSGTPQATTATASGTGERIITASGSPQATTATTTGTGERIITGSGSPQADTATSIGEGTVGNVITGSGTPQADTATASGSGERIITGSGTPQAGFATATGVGLRVITGSGTSTANTATTTGTGIRTITGSGSPQANTAFTIASGTVGDVVASAYSMSSIIPLWEVY